MKKILLSIAVAGIMFACGEKKQTYTVNGTIEGKTEGTAYLVVPGETSMDTLASAPITDGTYTLTGNLNGTTFAFITISGQRGGLPIFLENGVFTVTYGQNAAIEGGGPAQQLSNAMDKQFSEVQQVYVPKQQLLRESFNEAHAADDAEKMDEIRAEFDELINEIQDKNSEILKANGDSYVAAYHVYTMGQRLSLEDLKELFSVLSENAKMTTYGKKATERISKMEAVEIGQIAPDFTLDTPEGGKISLHAIQGKVKLIDFWASWCGPCRAENPHVVKIYEEYHPKGLEIFGVSLDNDKDAWLKAIEDDGLIWAHGSDLQGWAAAPAKLYVVSGIPHTVLLDENNKIIAKNLRGTELESKIAELLK